MYASHEIYKHASQTPHFSVLTFQFINPARSAPHFSVFTFQFSVNKKSPIPFGTGLSPYIVRKLFNCINNCLECLWLVKSKVSQNLTVEGDTLNIHLANKL